MTDLSDRAIPARVCSLDELPNAARAMTRDARSLGWRVVASYAAGHPLGDDEKIVERYLLRMRTALVGAAAFWDDGHFAGALWLSPIRCVTSPELKKLIKEHALVHQEGLF